jgi:hypothetical protein
MVTNLEDFRAYDPSNVLLEIAAASHDLALDASDHVLDLWPECLALARNLFDSICGHNATGD